jgi:hypothetical protein
MWPFHYYTLAYCKLVHLISIEFQSIDSNLGTKKTFSSLAIVVIMHSMQHIIGIVRHKILWLKVEKKKKEKKEKKK